MLDVNIIHHLIIIEYVFEDKEKDKVRNMKTGKPSSYVNQIGKLKCVGVFTKPFFNQSI